MIREIKSHNIIKLTTYLQQSCKYQGPQKPCDIIGASYYSDCGGICYVHLLLTGSEPLTYSNYIFTHFDNRRIT